ncbi:MAG: diaminopimelate epimerase [Planctomycetota bacterium]|nr:MAG: diaminopimelate epimerase [Planctomycetota bacterium]
MRFTKMQGAGNDYVYVDCFAETLPTAPAELAPIISDRHFGVGGDGLILIEPSTTADAKMRIFNADGSEAEMCGNGVRCVAKYVYDHGIAKKNPLHIETGRGVLTLHLELRDDLVERVRVDMGEPILDAAQIPTTLPGSPVVDAQLSLDSTPSANYRVTCVSMGNPHCIIFVDQATDELVHTVGPQIERHPAFPQRINTEFVEVLSPTEVKMRVWERGSGETLACGTGASAVGVAGVLTGKTNRRVTVHLLGGDLEIEWAENNHVFMTGPAVEVFTGEWPE